MDPCLFAIASYLCADFLPQPKQMEKFYQELDGCPDVAMDTLESAMMDAATDAATGVTAGTATGTTTGTTTDTTTDTKIQMLNVHGNVTVCDQGTLTVHLSDISLNDSWSNPTNDPWNSSANNPWNNPWNDVSRDVFNEGSLDTSLGTSLDTSMVVEFAYLFLSVLAEFEAF